MRERDVWQQEGNRRTKGDTNHCLLRASVFLVKKVNTLHQQVKEIITRICEHSQLLEQQFMIDRGKVVGDIAFDDVKRALCQTKYGCDSGLASIQTVAAVAIGIRIYREPGMKLAVQNAVEQQINHALFPGRNVEGAMLSVEVVAQSYSRAEIKVFALQ